SVSRSRRPGPRPPPGVPPPEVWAVVVALSPDGSRAAAVTIEGTVYVWDVATGAELLVDAHAEASGPPAGSLRVARDGRLLPSSASARLFARAQRLIPGGTSKANFNVKPHPFYVASGRGCRITDLDGVERLDAINNFTALVHGHAFPPVVQAVTEQVARGSAFAASTREEVELAQLLV